MNHENLTELINFVFKSVTESEVGKIIGPPVFKNEEGKILVSEHCFSLFINLICQLCPKGTLTADMTVKEPPEDWKIESSKD